MAKMNKYFQQYKKRITNQRLVLPTELWNNVEEINDENVEELVSSLQVSVSNGFMGVAAEISDFLEASNLLENKPSLKIAVELERMKRLYYMGFVQPTLSLSNKVIKLVNENKLVLTKEEVSFYKGIALGYTGWVSNDSNKLKEIIKDWQYSISDKTLSAERIGFTYALKGRYNFLLKKEENFHHWFNKAIEICNKNELWRSLAYIKIIYAEHLSELGNENWGKAIHQIENFITHSSLIGFNTHLLIRAIILYFKAPEQLINNKDINALAFRYHLLVYSMGLTQAQNLYPLLHRAKLNIPERNILDPYHYDLRSALRSWVNNLDWMGFEKLLILYYSCLGYDVPPPFPTKFPTFDFVASYDSIDGIGRNTSAIQAKHWKDKLTKKKIPDTDAFELGLDEINKPPYNISEISSVYWYLSSSIAKEAQTTLISRVKKTYGISCRVEIITGLDTIVDLLLNVPEILPRIVLSDEWDKS